LVRGEEVFVHPARLLRWEQIVPRAVAQNTFRGFHKVNKDIPGGKQGFVNYFLENRLELVDALSRVHSRPKRGRQSIRD
jgi:hypothetical protein